MKLAEALQERADLNRKIEDLRSRITDNALVQENEKPAEDPIRLIKELDGCVNRLEWLMERINVTNCETTVAVNGEEKTLTRLIAQKDALSLKISVYKQFVHEASQTTGRARFSEIRILPALDVSALQKQIDALSKELRLVDNALQENNWKTDLLQ